VKRNGRSKLTKDFCDINLCQLIYIIRDEEIEAIEIWSYVSRKEQTGTAYR
jgi:hypothetical protein